MTDVQVSTDQQEVWLRIEHNDTSEGVDPWKLCGVQQAFTTNVAQTAAEVLRDHDTSSEVWTRVTVWPDYTCTGEPIHVSNWIQHTGSEIPSATTHPVVPPDAELAQGYGAKVLPFLQAGSDPVGSDRPTQIDGPDDRAETSSDPSESTPENKPDDERRTYRVTIQNLTDGVDTETAQHIVGLINQARLSTAEDALRKYGKSVDEAVALAKSYAAEHCDGADWWDTEYGLSVAAHASSGFTAAFVHWQLMR